MSSPIIRFAHPITEEMACGYTCIELTDSGSWESFPVFAEAFIKQLDGKVLRKVQGIDMIVYLFACQGAELNLVYRDYPNGISIEPQDEAGDKVTRELFELLKAQSSPDGL